MAYKINYGGLTCTDGEATKCWSDIYKEIENGAPASFVLDLKDEKYIDEENDDLGHLLDFALCMCTHMDKKFYLSIKCKEENVEKVANKYTIFMRFLLENFRFELRINSMFKTAESIKNHIPDAFFPLLIFDKTLYEQWFVEKLQDNGRLRQHFLTDGQNEESPFYLSMAMKVCRKMLYSKTTAISEKAKCKMTEIFDGCFQNHNVMTILLTCILYNRNKNKSGIIGKEAKKQINGALNKAYIYMLGIKEICENILKHTEKGKGIIYIRSLSYNKAIERFQSNAHLSETMVFDSADRWIELSIIDAGNRGILETQKGNAIDLCQTFEWSYQQSNPLFQLEDYQDTKEIEDMIYHKGLKVFANQIANSRGMFSVQTINARETLNYSKVINKRVIKKQSKLSLGTQYKVWLPMGQHIQQNQSEEILWNREIIDGYRAYQHYQIDAKKTVEEILYEAKSVYHQVQINTSGWNLKPAILRECKKILQIIEKNNEAIYYFDFANTTGIQAVKLLYFLALIGKVKNIKYIVLYNVKRELLREFQITYQDDVYERHGREAENNSINTYLFVYDEKGTPIFVTNNFDRKHSEELRDYLWSYRGIYYDWENEKNNSSWECISLEERKAILAPVELLGSEENGSFSAPIFERHMEQLFENNLSDNEKFGLRYIGHVNLDDKIHVKNYYQGELLFDNNYYLSALANILSRVLRKKKKLFLVGYKKYSAGLLDKMCERLGTSVLGTYIYENSEEEFLHNIADDTEIVIIIPLSSTLRTFEKVERFLRLKIVGEQKYSYYTFFVSRDRFGQVTELEKRFNWAEIGEKYIDVCSEWPLTKWHQSRLINYFMLLEGEWEDASKCKLCDLDEGNIEALMGTGEESLTLSVKLGIPHNESVNNCTCFTDDLNDNEWNEINLGMSHYIVEGHFERSNNHFKHYLYCKNFFEEYLNDSKYFSQWLQVLKENFAKEVGYVNVLLVPANVANNPFCKRVNKDVFEENTIIINEDFHKEFYSDFTKKYNYLKKLKKIRYIFLDECVNTGHTWQKVYSLVSTGKQEEVFYIISLVNRLDYCNKKLLKNKQLQCFFFTEILIPTIKEQDGNCWLCDESRQLNDLCADAFSINMKQYYRNNSKKSENCFIVEEKDEEFEVFRKRRKNTEINFRITNEIYRRLFVHYEELQSGEAERFKLYLGVDKNYRIVEDIITPNNKNQVSWEYKMAFVKTLSRPFMNSFAGLRNFCLRVCVNEFNALLLMDPNNYEERERELQIKYLIVLLKRFASLDSRFILQKNVFDRVLDFYVNTIWVNKKSITLKNVKKIHKNFNLQIHYAVAVKKLICNNEVNTLKYWSEFRECFKELICYNDSEQKVHTKKTFRKQVMHEFVENVFCSKDTIIANCGRNYMMDNAITDSSVKEERLKNHTYYNYTEETKIFGVEDKKEKILESIKCIFENMEGQDFVNRMDEVGITGLFKEIFGCERTPSVYFYRSSSPEDSERIKIKELTGRFDGESDYTCTSNLHTLLEIITTMNENDLVESQNVLDKSAFQTGNLRYNKSKQQIYINLSTNLEIGIMGVVIVAKIPEDDIYKSLAFYRILSGISPEVFTKGLVRLPMESPITKGEVIDVPIKQLREGKVE